MLLWLDLETTGLDASKEHVLEVAAIMTDDSLRELGRFHAVTDEAQRVLLKDVDPYVRKMHFENGLWAESMCDPESDDISVRHRLRFERTVDNVDERLMTFITDQVFASVPETQRSTISGAEVAKLAPQLAGNTISFDRAFLAAHLPRAHAALHYRNLDVTTLNELARRFWPEVWKGRPRAEKAAHRAMADCEESLRCAQYYAEKLGPVVTEAAA